MASLRESLRYVAGLRAASASGQVAEAKGLLLSAVAWIMLLAASAPCLGRAQELHAQERDALHVEPGPTCMTAGSLAAQVGAWLGEARVEPELSVYVRAHPQVPEDVAFEVQKAGQAHRPATLLPGTA
jgi:hypothetical protein